MWKSLYPKIKPYCTSENTYRKESLWERPHPEVKAHFTLESKAIMSVMFPEEKVYLLTFKKYVLTFGLIMGNKVSLFFLFISVFTQKLQGEKEAEV